MTVGMKKLISPKGHMEVHYIFHILRISRYPMIIEHSLAILNEDSLFSKHEQK